MSLLKAAPWACKKSPFGWQIDHGGALVPAQGHRLPLGFDHAGHSSLRLFVALLVLLFFTLLTTQLQPFRQQEDNLVSTLANILLLCAFLGMGAG
tara:strand:- start:243 stop:527 length:285 start_codon:yes stop_codon:yes gene_type:complete